MPNMDTAEIVARLRPMLARHSDYMNVVMDDAENYYLDTHHVMKNGKPLFFGSVRVRKNYVSYHLMPVYVNPGLLRRCSNALTKRMQGKSCFNFRRVDEAVLDELSTLTDAGFEFYASEGYIRPNT